MCFILIYTFKEYNLRFRVRPQPSYFDPEIAEKGPHPQVRALSAIRGSEKMCHGLYQSITELLFLVLKCYEITLGLPRQHAPAFRGEANKM